MIDAHIHLCNADVFKQRQSFLQKIYENKVDLLLSCTASSDDFCRQDIVLAETENVYAFYGLHPWNVREAQGDWSDTLQEKLKQKKVVGVGETGLDCLKDDFPLQVKVFKIQAELAAEENALLTVHNVKADKEIIEILSKIKNLPYFILHSFSGYPENIKIFADMGGYFSFSSRIIKKKAEYIKQVMAEIPTDRLLIESDFDNPNKIFDLDKTYRFVAETLNLDYKELQNLVYDNMKRLLKV